MSAKAPKAPDPAKTAEAQAKYSKEAAYDSAALNQINQQNPWGTISWSGEIGGPDRTQTLSLTPELQSMFTQGTGIANQLLGIAGGYPQKVQDAWKSPTDFSGHQQITAPDQSTLPGVRSYDTSGFNPFKDYDSSSFRGVSHYDPLTYGQSGIRESLNPFGLSSRQDLYDPATADHDRIRSVEDATYDLSLIHI